MAENNEMEQEDLEQEAISEQEENFEQEVVEETDWNETFGKLTSSKKKQSADIEPTDMSEYLDLDMLQLLVQKFRENRDNEVAPVRAVVNVSDVKICFKEAFDNIQEISVMRDIKRSLKAEFLETHSARVLINKRKGENYLKPVSITIEDMTHVPTVRPKKSNKSNKSKPK